jgi:hypothetical protein
MWSDHRPRTPCLFSALSPARVAPTPRIFRIALPGVGASSCASPSPHLSCAPTPVQAALATARAGPQSSANPQLQRVPVPPVRPSAPPVCAPSHPPGPRCPPRAHPRTVPNPLKTPPCTDAPAAPSAGRPPLSPYPFAPRPCDMHRPPPRRAGPLPAAPLPAGPIAHHACAGGALPLYVYDKRGLRRPQHTVSRSFTAGRGARRGRTANRRSTLSPACPAAGRDSACAKRQAGILDRVSSSQARLAGREGGLGARQCPLADRVLRAARRGAANQCVSTGRRKLGGAARRSTARVGAGPRVQRAAHLAARRAAAGSMSGRRVPAPSQSGQTHEPEPWHLVQRLVRSQSVEYSARASPSAARSFCAACRTGLACAAAAAGDSVPAPLHAGQVHWPLPRHVRHVAWPRSTRLAACARGGAGGGGGVRVRVGVGGVVWGGVGSGVG